MRNFDDVWIQLLIIGMFLLAGYILPKSKLVAGVETLLLVVVLGGYNGVGDLDNYRIRYNNEMISQNIFEQFYDRLAACLHAMGIQFEVFHFLVTSISIFVFAYIAINLSPEPALVMSMMVGFSTIESALQIQFLCASAIVAYALYFFYSSALQKNKKNALFIYIVLIILAMEFHFVALFFLAFLLYNFASAKYLKYWVVAALGIAITALPMLMQIATQFIPTLGDYSTYRRNAVIIGMSLWQLSGVWVVAKTYRYLNRNLEKGEGTIGALRLAEFIYKGSLIVLMTIPFYMWTTVASRIVRLWMIFYFILITLIPRKKGKINLCRLLMVCYNFASVILFYIILPDNNGYNVLFDVLENNLFW